MIKGRTARAIALPRSLCAVFCCSLIAFCLSGTFQPLLAFCVDPETEIANTKVADDKTPAEEVESPPSITIDLLGQPLSETWQTFHATEKKEGMIPWKLTEREGVQVLSCTGTPKGFLYTRKSFDDFELEFEWRYPTDENGNSGILVFTQEEPRLWPTSMQVQLHQPKAGSVFPGGDAKSDNSTNANGLALSVGEWNKCRIIALDGKVSVQINGTAAGEVNGCQPNAGRIAIQSEGSLTEFRKMKLTIPRASLPQKQETAAPVPAGTKTANGKPPGKDVRPENDVPSKVEQQPKPSDGQ